jgi:S1-C subfamily serine protease
VGVGQRESHPEDQYIGSGFVIQKDGLIVTNKHVVSDSSITYEVIDHDGKKHKVNNIYRDPLNDIAILKIDNAPPGGFNELEMGDSSKLKPGQFVVAIGTPLGEFTNTVTFGVISGLGRGINAGSPYQGYAERLDNVIQTDAAINPGNSGGPLLNSAGQVIGVNTAISSQGQNIGFAIPINTIKASVSNFNKTGQFNRPFLGISYDVVSERAALANEIPQGALVGRVLLNSSADHAGIKVGDIITKIDGKKVSEDNGGIANIISNKKIGDTIRVEFYREGNTKTIEVKLEAAPSQ